MTELLLRMASLVVMAIAMVTRPTSAACPAGMHNNGIRPSGRFECLFAPTGDPDADGTWRRPDRSTVRPGELAGRIYCTGGAHAIVVDDRVVGCQR